MPPATDGSGTGQKTAADSGDLSVSEQASTTVSDPTRADAYARAHDAREGESLEVPVRVETPQLPDDEPISLESELRPDDGPSSVTLPEVPTAVVAGGPKQAPRIFSLFRFNRTALLMTTAILVVLALLVGVAVALFNNNRQSLSSNNGAGDYSTGKLSLGNIQPSDELQVGMASQLSINGLLKVNDSFVLVPSTTPTAPVAGQFYYNKADNTAYFYNGTQFVSLSPAHVSSIGGQAGAITLDTSLQITNNNLGISNALLQQIAGASANGGPHVTSVQGVSGAVTLNGGSGITINGTTISNSGLVSLTSGSGNLVITNDGAGNYTITDSGGGGSVTSLTGTPNQVNVSSSTGNVTLSLPQDINVASTPTFGGLTVTGTLAVQGAGGLTVGNTGVDGKLTLTSSGGGSIALQSGSTASNLAFTLPVADGSNGYCLKTNGSGTLSFQQCTGGPGGGVSSLNNQTDIVVLNNATGSGGFITIDNAKADGATKGIATFNSTNFTDNGSGVINTVQGISTAATPTFAGLTINGTATATTLNATSVIQLNGTSINVAGTLSNVAYLNGTGPQIFSGNNKFTGTVTAQLTSPTAFQVQDGLGTSNLFIANTSTDRIGIGTLGPGYKLDVQGGDINTSGIYRVNGAQISSADLSNDSNLAKLNGANTFSAANTFSSTVSIQGANSLTLGSGSNVGSIIFRDGSSANTGTLQLAGVLSGNVTYSLPVATGSQTVCTVETGNCAGSGSGITGSGTANKLAKFTGSQAIGDSSISDDGTVVTVATGQIVQGAAGLTIGTTGIDGKIVLTNSVNSNTLTLQSGATTGNLTLTLPTADGSNGNCLKTNGSGVLSFASCTGGAGGGVTSINTLTGVLNIVGTANQVSVSSAGDTITLSLPQDINTGGNANFRTVTLTGQAAGDNLIVGNAVSGATGNLIDLKVNNVSQFTVTPNGNVNTVGQYQVNGVQIASSDLSDGSNLAKLNGTGPQVFTGDNQFTGTTQVKLDAPAAFSVENSTGSSHLLVADTTTSRVGIGTNAPGYTLDVNGDVNTSGVYRINGVTVCSATGCTPSSGSGSYIQNGTTPQTADFNITGSGVIGTSLTTPSVTSTGALSVQAGGTNNALTLDSSGTGAVTLGNGASSKTVTIGNTTGSTQVNILSGNGNASGDINVGNVALASGTRLINIGATASTTASTTINIGTSNSLTNSQNVNIGTNIAGNSSVLLQAGTTGSIGLQVGAGGTINVGTLTNNVLNLGTGAVAGAIKIGGTAQTGTLTVGQSTATNTISIGSAAGNGNTQTINIGTSATAGSTTNLTLGSTIAGTLTLQGATVKQTVTGGSVTIQNITNDSTTAFQIQNTGGGNLFVADTQNSRVGVNTGAIALNTNFNVYNGGASTIQTQFTQNLRDAGINVMSDYIQDAYTSGLFWSTQNNNPTSPKAGIYTQLTNNGSKLLFGTSKSYSAGLTNTALTLGYNGEAIFRNSDDTSVGFQVQDHSGNGLLTVNTATGATLTSSLYVDILGSGGTTALCWNGSLQISTCASTGSIGFWNRTGTILQPATAGDAITTSGNISTSGTGTVTSAGLLTGTAGLTVTGGAANINASGTGSVNIGNASSGAIAVQSGSTIAITAGTSLNLTSTGSNAIGINPGGGSNTGVVVRPGTDTTNLFQIQNALTGASLLNVDSLNSNITLLGNDSGALGPWQTASNALPAIRNVATSVVANGYVYVIGGSSGTPQSTVYYAKLNSDGSVGTWNTAANALPTTVYQATSVASNGYVYVMGGVGSSTVYYAKLNSDGSVGTWNTASNALPGNRQQATSVVANGYVYVIGGSNGTIQSTVYYAKLNSDGSVGTWNTAANALPGARSVASSVTANGYVYVIGGSSGTPQSTVYYAKLNSDGSVGTWNTAANALPATRIFATSGISNGYVYEIGGSNSSFVPQSTVYYAKLNSDGSVGSWSTASNALPDARINATSVVSNGYIYELGGTNAGGTVQSTVYYTSTPRLQVGGSLDLVGLQGGNLADGDSQGLGSVGGNLTAGDTNIVGTLQVQGAANFSQSVAINGALNVGNDVTVTATSTQAFQVQNSAGDSVLNVDSQNSTVTLQAGTDAATLGTELFTGSTSFPATTGWGSISGTGQAATATHVSGTTALSPTPAIGITSGNYYLVSWDVTNPNSGGNLTITMGGQTLAAYSFDSNDSGTYTFTDKSIIQASSTANLSFTPNSAFTGKISNVSIKQLTYNDAPVLVVNNVAGAPNLEVRASSNFDNLFMGGGSGAANVTGDGNLAVGAFTLQNNVSGTGNTALGQNALKSNISGDYNVGIGFAALNSNTTGDTNVAIGSYALNNNTGGVGNIAIGGSTLQSNIDGFDNIALGRNTLNAATTASYNLGIGSYNLQNVTTAGSNIALGYSSLRDTTSGNNNNSIGVFSLEHNTSGADNVALGTQTLNDNTGGSQNVVLGNYSMFNNTTGSYNVALGTQSLEGNTTGSYNTAIGREADVLYSGLQNATVIGAEAEVGSNDTIILGYSAGRGVYDHVGIGTSYAQNPFEVAPNTYDNGTISQSSGSGNVVGSGTAFTAQMVGATLFYSDGSQGIVTGYTDGTHITSSNTTGGWSGADYAIVWGGFNVNTDASVWLQNTTDSQGAFAVVNTAGNILLSVNTSNASVNIAGVGANGGGGRLTFGDYDPTSDLAVFVGEEGTGDTDILQLNGANGVHITSGSYSSPETVGAFSYNGGRDSGVLSLGETTSGGYLEFDNNNSFKWSIGMDSYNACSGSTPADTLYFYSNVAGGCALQFTSSGNATFKSASANSAFQIQNSGGNPLFNVNSTSNAITLFSGVTGGTLTTDIAGTKTSNAVCHSGGAGANENVQIVACTGSIIADYAEKYPVASGTDYGDIVVTGTNMVNTYNADADGNADWSSVKGQVTQLVKSSAPYQTNTIGIVSDNYNNFTSAGNNIKDEDNPMPVALNGRVPVNVAPGSGAIQPGDYLTTSGDSGKAMKATQGGFVIGKALEAWDPASGKTQVMVFVEPGYWPGPTQADYLQNGGNATLANLNVSGTATINDLTVTGAATIADLTVTGSARFAGDITVGGHIITAGGQPTSQPQAAAGTAAAVSVDGTDTTGTITITTGSTPTAGDLAKILFSQTYGKAPHVVLSASNDKAAALHFYKGVTSATDFMFTALDAPAPNTTYTFDYVIAQ
jgi:hypothetical protein